MEAKLELIQSMLNYYYLYGDEGVDYDSAILKGYVDALGDPYTVYYTPDEYAAMAEDSSGVYCGIGVSIQQNTENMLITIIRVFKDSPAEKAGLKAGDQFYKVDDEEVLNQDINIVVTKVRGEPGTDVKMKVWRPSDNDYYETVCTRAQVQNETILYEMKEDNIGYIELTEFDDVTYEQFVNAYEHLHENGMEGLIIDLRSNGGGLLSSVVDILDYLLPKGILTYTVDKYGAKDIYESSDDKASLDVPLIVLCNDYSASASEVMIGCLRDYGVCTLMGTQTFGKGIVQVILPMSDGSGVKVTIADYYSPNGTSIHKVGFTPDIIVEYDSKQEEDNQIAAAMEEMRKKLGIGQ